MAKKAAEGVTIAFLGTGAMDVDNATDLIEEFIESIVASDDDPVPVFVFPLTSTEFSETLESNWWIWQSNRTSRTNALPSRGDTPRRNFNDIASGAAKTYHVPDVYTQMEHILVEAPTAILEVLWDDSRDDEDERDPRQVPRMPV